MVVYSDGGGDEWWWVGVLEHGVTEGWGSWRRSLRIVWLLE